MVEDIEFTSYYGHSVVKPVPWRHEISIYLFTGGVAGGSGLLAAGAHAAGLPAGVCWGGVGEAAGELGFIGVNLPEEYGGGGAGIYELALVQEELAAKGAGLLLVVVSPAICGTIIGKYGTDEQKSAWLEKIASGEVVASFALTEPGAGSDPAGLRTKAVRDGDDWVITGEKRFITNAPLADLFVVFARTRPADENGTGIAYQASATSDGGPITWSIGGADGAGAASRCCSAPGSNCSVGCVWHPSCGPVRAWTSGCRCRWAWWARSRRGISR